MNKNLNKTISAIAVTVVLFGSAAGAVMAESGYVHGRTLKMGSRGESVKMLQEALNSCFGSDISEDGVFGRGTRSEVIAAQRELGLRGDGVVGSMTGRKIAACEPTEVATTPATTTTTTTTTTTPATDLTKFTSGKGMEVRTRNFQVRNASQAQAEEGAKGVEVARFTFDVQQSDALIERMNIFTKANGTVSPTTPWRVFDKLTVMVNGKEAGSVITNNASNWDDQGSSIYKVVVGGLASVIKKDTTADIRIVADLNAGANGQVADVKWDIYTDGKGFRMTDEAAITQYAPDTTAVTASATYTIKNVGSLTTARLSVGSNDPKSTTLEAKKTASSSDYTVQEYTIKAEDGDIKIKTLPISLKLTTQSASGTATVANAATTTITAATGYFTPSMVGRTLTLSGGATGTTVITAVNSTTSATVTSFIPSAAATATFTVSSFAATVASSVYGDAYNALIDTAWVTINGEKFDSVISKNYTRTAGSMDETNVINIDVNRRVTVKSGETATVKVMVKFKSLAEPVSGTANADSGSQLLSSVPAISGSTWAIENGTGDSIATSTGSATGYTHTVRTTGVIAKMGTATVSKVTANTGGTTTSVTYSIPVEVTAIGNTFYGAQTAVLGATVSGSDLIAYSLNKSTAPGVNITGFASAGVGTSADCTAASIPTGCSATVGQIATAALNSTTPVITTISSNAPISGTSLRFDDGSTKTVTINVTVSPIGTSVTEAYRIALKQIKVYTDSALSTGATSVNLIPSESFQTNYETFTR